MKQVLYVDGDFDDLGLDIYEYRLAGRVARRGECYETMASMAESCGMSRRTVRRKMARLVEYWGILMKEERPGQPNVYRLADRSNWRVKPRPREAQVPRPREAEVDPNPGHGRPHTPATGGRGGRPREAEVIYKVPPTKEVPLSINSAVDVAANRKGGCDFSFLCGGGDDAFLPVVQDLSERYAPEEVPQLLRDLWGKRHSGDEVLAWCRDVYRKHGFERLLAAVAIAKDRAEAGGKRPSIKLAAGVLRRLGGGRNGRSRASPDPSLPPPRPESVTADVRDAQMEIYELSENHFVRHETREGPRWTITEDGKKAKQAFEQRSIDQVRQERSASSSETSATSTVSASA